MNYKGITKAWMNIGFGDRTTRRCDTPLYNVEATHIQALSNIHSVDSHEKDVFYARS